MKSYKIIKQAAEKFFPSITHQVRQRKMKQFYASFISKGQLCFDIGANIGNRTDIFVSLGARVVAIEPQESCARLLREKYREESLVTIEQVALSSKEGISEMFISDISEISTLSSEFVESFQTDTIKWQSTEQVKVDTLDNLIERYGIPDFAKIDVEGFEVDVLEGLTQPIPALSFEFTGRLKYKIEPCLQLLEQLNHYQFNISFYESMKLQLHNWVSADEMRRFLLEVPDSILHGDIYARLDDQ